ncbi:hypothetical protein ACHAQA_005013 [Verticillium albo-atrum]
MQQQRQQQQPPVVGASPSSSSSTGPPDTPEGSEPEATEAKKAGKLKFKHYDTNTGGFQQTVPGTAVFSLPSRVRSRGAGFPRTRTGCKECKRRRVKCDETTPSCQRCIRGGHTCEGLLHAGTAIVPRARSRIGQQQLVPEVVSTSQTPLFQGINYVSLLFPNQHQWDSFQAFVQVAEQGGSLPADCLMELVPQVAQDDTAVREICCSIGALNLRNLRATQSIDRARHQASLEHYGRALQAVTRAGESTESLIRTILASLMFITLEMLRGDTDAAFGHFAHSRRMMDQYLRRRSAETGLSFAKLPLNALESSAFDMMQRIATHPWTVSTHPGSTESVRPFLPGLQHQHRVQDMPIRFYTIDEAVRWWDVTQHQVMNTIQAWQTRPHEDAYTSPSTGTRIQRGTEEEARASARVWAECLALTDRWRAGFRPLRDGARQSKETRPTCYLQTLTLESLVREAVAALVHAQGRSRDSNMRPTAPTPVYLEMAHATRRMVWQQLDRGVPVPVSLESALIRPLAFVVYKTRDPQVLEEVRSVLVEFSQDLQIATLLLGLMDGQGEGTSLDLVDRGWKWHFTCAGCSSGIGNMLKK